MFHNDACHGNHLTFLKIRTRQDGRLLTGGGGAASPQTSIRALQQQCMGMWRRGPESESRFFTRPNLNARARLCRSWHMNVHAPGREALLQSMNKT